MPFTTLGLRGELAAAVKKAGYVEPTPIQKQAIPEILQKHDLVGIAQTGTGKTAAFVLPMLQLMSTSAAAATRAPRALVIVPTRELAVQVEQNVKKYSENLKIRHATIYGGVGENPQIDRLRSGLDLVIATPGRLVDLMDRGFVDFRSLQFLVLDEADRMLDMGFLPSIRKIVRALPVERQTLLFSATFSKEIEQTAREFLHRPRTVEVSRRATAAEGVAQSVIVVSREQKLDMLLQLLGDPSFDSVLVFARTKHGADKIAKRLQQRGIPTATLHSNRSQAQRLDALERFKNGDVRVLVATDIAARGIDVVGISHVINFDFPPFPEDYVHRIGRTGRAQAIGDAVSFVMPDEMPTLRTLEKFIGRGIPRREVTPIVASQPVERVDSPRSSGRPPERVVWKKPYSSGGKGRESGARAGSTGRPAGAGRSERPAAPARGGSSRGVSARPSSPVGGARPRSSDRGATSGASGRYQRAAAPESERPSSRRPAPEYESGQPRPKRPATSSRPDPRQKTGESQPSPRPRRPEGERPRSNTGTKFGTRPGPPRRPR